MKRRADVVWNAALSRIRLGGASPTQRRRFYTALYHVHLGPTLHSDADGGYRVDGSGPLRNKAGADVPVPDARGAARALPPSSGVVATAPR